MNDEKPHMKLFLVNTSKKWGGGEKWHFDTACFLKNKGHDVTILTRTDSDLHKKSVLSGIRTMSVHVSNLSFLNPLTLLRLIRLFKKEIPQYVILNFSADIKTVGLAAKSAGIKNIIYRRGSAIPIRNTMINRFIYKNIITDIIANSEETKRTILYNNSGLFPAGRIRVIYNGIDLPHIDAMPVIRLYERKSNEVIIGSAGRLSPEKGHHYLVELAEVLKKRGKNFVILIAGEGPQELMLKDLAKQKGVEDRIVFLGFLNNIKAFMENIDIFVLPSIWEGFGYVTIEAMACNKPVVAFNTGSNPEIIRDNETGYLVNDFSKDSLTDKVETLIDDPALRIVFGHKGRLRVETYFSQAIAESNIEQFIREL